MPPYIAVIIVLVLLPIALTGFSLAPFVPCRKKDLKRINTLTKLKSGQKFYELGSGDGRVSRYIAKNNPQAKIIGIELAITLYLWTKLKNFIFRIKNLEFKNKNIFHINLSEADVIYFYGMPKAINNKLLQKLKSEMKPTARIISYVFKIQELKLITINKPTPKDASINVYSIT